MNINPNVRQYKFLDEDRGNELNVRIDIEHLGSDYGEYEFYEKIRIYNEVFPDKQVDEDDLHLGKGYDWKFKDFWKTMDKFYITNPSTLKEFKSLEDFLNCTLGGLFDEANQYYRI